MRRDVADPEAGSATYGKVSRERRVVGVDAVAEVVRLAHQLALGDLQRDVDDVVGQAAAVREALRCRRRGRRAGSGRPDRRSTC